MTTDVQDKAKLFIALQDLMNAIHRAYENEASYDGTWYENIREEYNQALYTLCDLREKISKEVNNP